ncbi:AraC family transcriptional regulator [Lachnoclostridium sp. Marseille-P6806]|uniref:AraC family transcriptional regulator n=1 Tax=Lachnoclostridium sp. Marseille-P6806 TaxID=2364793 RepID=UPI0013EEF79D|nr:AraC family transcriptional regulator [Lachnoclostridium sp. Marseille-P6806]
MRMIALPKNQIYRCRITGKFKALNDRWEHESFPLPDYELIVVTEGTLYLRYLGENFTVRENEYLLLPPSSSRRSGFRKAYCSFYWLHFSAENGGDSYELPQTGKLPRLFRMVVLMKQLQDISKSNYPQISIDTMATTIMTELYGQLASSAHTEKSAADRKQIYLDIIDYIQRNLSRSITISEIAEQFGYNARYLSHLFSKIRGIPLKQFILNQKMDAANFMLTDNDNSISDIAESLGFSNVHNFSRTYKKITGLTPSEYRNAYARRLLYHV